VLLAGFSYRLAPAVEALRDAGLFDAAGWAARQVTTGRTVRIERADGVETVRALGVDPATGALVIADATAPGGERRVVVGEISHVRVADSSTVAV
jgi:biotin-(acetyl-CoA carboxylase) ligase